MTDAEESDGNTDAAAADAEYERWLDEIKPRLAAASNAVR